MNTNLNNVTQKVRQYKKQLILIGVLLVAIFLILLVIKLIFYPSHVTENNRQPISNTTVAPTQQISVQRNSQLDKGIPPGAQPSSKALTQQEIHLPEAKPQTFSGNSTTENGVLVITSTIPGVDILIDTPKGSESETGASNFVPTNTTPVKMSKIPAGYYLIDARKDGYDESEFIIRIDPDNVTRLTVSLNPLSAQ